MGLQVIIARESVAREEIMHRLVKLDTQRRTLMVEKEKDSAIVTLPHANLDRIRHFQQRMEVADLPQP